MDQDCQNQCSSEIFTEMFRKKNEKNEMENHHKEIRYSDEKLAKWRSIDREYDNLHEDYQRCMMDCENRARARNRNGGYRSSSYYNIRTKTKRTSHRRSRRSRRGHSRRRSIRYKKEKK